MSAVIDALIRREGGFVHDPADRGGATKYGITQATLSAWRGRSVTVDDVRALSEDEARAIYRREYISEPKFDLVVTPGAPALRELLIDAGVQHGPQRAVQWLQRAVGAKPDGVIGPKTLDAIHRFDDDAAIYRSVFRQRMRFYAEIIRNDPTQARFAVGWFDRLGEFVA